jgi:hypothetical protein
MGKPSNSYNYLLLVMAKINEDLSPGAHQILKNYQHANGFRNQGEALNKILIRFEELLEKETLTYWKPVGDLK